MIKSLAQALVKKRVENGEAHPLPNFLWDLYKDNEEVPAWFYDDLMSMPIPEPQPYQVIFYSAEAYEIFKKAIQEYIDHENGE